MKKKIRLSLTIFLGLFFLFTVKSLATVEIQKYQAEYKVKESGNVEVVENITYKVEDEYISTFTRNINTKNEINAKNSADRLVLKSIKVNGKEQERVPFGTEGRNGIYEYRIDEDNYNIKVFEPTMDDKITVTYEYTLENVVVKYKDSAELFWNFIQSDNKYEIKSLEAKFILPTPAFNKDMYLYVYGAEKGEQGEYNKYRNEISFKTNNIKANNPVDVRILMVPECIPEPLKTVNKNIIKKYSKQEEGFIAKRETPKVLEDLSMAQIVIYSTILVAVFGAIIAIFIKKRKLAIWVHGILLAGLIVFTTALSLVTIETTGIYNYLLLLFLASTAIVYSLVLKKINLEEKLETAFTILHFLALQIANISLLVMCNISFMYIPYILAFGIMQYILRKNTNREQIKTKK